MCEYLHKHKENQETVIHKQNTREKLKYPKVTKLQTNDT